jgi:hypothetical protein
VEKAEREKRKKHREEEQAAKVGETAYWKDVAARGWGNQLQAVMKSGVAPPPGSYTGVYLLSASRISAGAGFFKLKRKPEHCNNKNENLQTIDPSVVTCCAPCTLS